MSTGPEQPEQPEQQPSLPPTGPVQPPGPLPPVGYQWAAPPMRPDEEKLWAIAAHLGPLVVGLFAPLVVWLVFKDRSAFLDRTGKEALNMQLSYLIYGGVAFVTVFLLIGFLLVPLVGIAWFVLMIVATIRLANFEEYRYPAIIRFLS